MGAVVRAAFGYCFLVLMVRVAGRRPGKQMTPQDFVLIFFMGGLALTPMVAGDRSLSNSLIVIISIALTHYAITLLKQHSPAFGRVVDGVPLVLFKCGEWQIDTMNKTEILKEDVMAAVRNKGLKNLDEVEYVILERNGELSIISGQK